jgi:hypothetical protein
MEISAERWFNRITLCSNSLAGSSYRQLVEFCAIAGENTAEMPDSRSRREKAVIPRMAVCFLFFIVRGVSLGNQYRKA